VRLSLSSGVNSSFGSKNEELTIELNNYVLLSPDVISLDEINKVEWIPSWGKERIYQMVENRPDWCISRQRSWGVPITVFYCKGCKETIFSREICEYVANLMDKSGADVWFDKDVKELMPKGIKHATQKILHYKFYPDFKNAKITKTNLSWNETETIIAEEINWLKQNILTMTSHEPKHPLLHCCDCILRKIALLIVSGNVQTTYFETNSNTKDLWKGLTKSNKIPSIHRHGHDWHKKMMDVVSEYFKKYKIETEPTLHYGRADLQIIINPKTTLYVEIGTVSLFKLWYNLWVMKNTTFLIIPDENYAIEFRT